MDWQRLRDYSWKGFRYGGVTGAVVSVLVDIAIISDPSSTLNGALDFIFTCVLTYLFLGVLGALIGGFAGVVISLIIETVSLVFWVITALLGFLLFAFELAISYSLEVSLMTVTTFSATILPGLIFVKRYLSDRLPRWMDKGLEEVIPVIVASTILSCIKFLWEWLTGLELLILKTHI